MFHSSFKSGKMPYGDFSVHSFYITNNTHSFHKVLNIQYLRYQNSVLWCRLVLFFLYIKFNKSIISDNPFRKIGIWKLILWENQETGAPSHLAYPYDPMLKIYLQISN